MSDPATTTLDPLEELAGQLLAQEAWTDAVTEASGAGLVSVTADGRIEWINAGGAAMCERTVEQCLGEPIAALIPAFPSAADDVIEAGQARPERYPAWIAAPGRVAVPIRLAAVRVRRGRQSILVGGFYPIGELLDVEQQLRESEGRFDALVQRSPDGLVVVQGRRVVFANPALEGLVGDAIGRETQTLFGPNVQDDVADWVRRAESGETVRTMETMVVHPDGEPRFVDGVWTRIEFEGAAAVLGILRDATEVRRMRVQLAQADRLASLGVLAAGVAREVNNPLTYVLSNLVEIGEALGAEGDDAPPRAELRRWAARALDGARRIRRIAGGLTTFARVDAQEAGPVDVVGVLEDAMRLADTEIRRRAHVVARIDEVSPVRGTAGQLAQVFLNLLLNAAQAIEPGDRDANEIRVDVDEDGDEVRIGVGDTGTGIAPENLSRLFEPFFTTKPQGVGSGLGLSICQRIVESFGGRIEVSSVLGEGTTMTVILPAEEPAEPRLLDRLVSGRRGRLMVVDDDPAVLDSLRRLLQAGGHEVVAVGSGQAAADFLAGDDGFDLVLTDLMMDGMNGIQLYEHLDQRHPQLARRLVFVSGGAFDQDTREFLARVPNKQLSKPFELDSLLGFVADQLSD